jgi:hypothetical protein
VIVVGQPWSPNPNPSMGKNEPSEYVKMPDPGAVSVSVIEWAIGVLVPSVVVNQVAKFDALVAPMPPPT